MPPATALPAPVIDEVSEHRQLDRDYNAFPRQITSAPNRDGSLAYDTNDMKLRGPNRQTTDIGTFVGRDNTTQKLFQAWAEKSIRLMTDWDNDYSLNEAVRLSERYLLTMFKSNDHRMIIASTLNVLRFSPIDHQSASQIAKILAKYQKQDVSRKNTISLIRELRANGLSPSSLGALDVKQV